MNDRTTVPELESLLRRIPHRIPPRDVRQQEADPLNEMARLIADTHEHHFSASHDVLMHALGVEPAPRVRPPALREAFFPRPYFDDPEFLAIRRRKLASQVYW